MVCVKVMVPLSHVRAESLQRRDSAPSHMHTYVYSHMYKHVHTHIYMCALTHVHMCTLTHVPTYTHVHEHAQSTHRHTCTLMCMHIHVYSAPSHMHTRDHTCIHMCPHTCTHMCTYTSILTYAHVCTHTCIHMCTHTWSKAQVWNITHFAFWVHVDLEAGTCHPCVYKFLIVMALRGVSSHFLPITMPQSILFLDFACFVLR